MWRVLSVFLHFLGFVAMLTCVFYGYFFYWQLQSERAKDIQSLASIDSFSEKDVSDIRSAIVQEVRKLELLGFGNDIATFVAVKNWVALRIKYDSDLRNYGMPEYFATAKEVYDRGVDDCDGIAILGVAVLKLCGVQKAKVALTNVHAELSVPGVVLPSPVVIKKAEPFSKRFEFLLAALSSVPWLRFGAGLIIFAAFCECGVRCVHKSYGFSALIALTLITVGLLFLELFSRQYLLRPAIEAITYKEWVFFFAGCSVIGCGLYAWYRKSQ